MNTFNGWKEYKNSTDWLDRRMISFNRDILTKTSDVMFVANIKYEFVDMNNGVIAVKIPNDDGYASFSTINSDIQDAQIFEMYESEFKSYKSKLKRERKKKDNVKVSRKRYEELLETEAMYNDLCK